MCLVQVSGLLTWDNVGQKAPTQAAHEAGECGHDDCLHLHLHLVHQPQQGVHDAGGELEAVRVVRQVHHRAQRVPGRQ
jgi:hypothetical protein